MSNEQIKEKFQEWREIDGPMTFLTYAGISQEDFESWLAWHGETTEEPSPEIYVVTAYRWGSQNGHSYVVGAFDDRDKAIACAGTHTTYRGGKYACVVDECVLNESEDEEDEYTIEVYRTRSIMCPELKISRP